MTPDDAYSSAHKKIRAAQRSKATELDLSGYHTAGRLTELPESLSESTTLQSLNLSGNRLTGLPECLLRLEHLKHLNLSDNALKDLPEEIVLLAHLESLNLFSNQLTGLPSLTDLKRLKSLDLIDNRFTFLPESLCKVEGLQSLQLAYNRLTDLPVALADLRHLKYLDLSSNPLNPELAAAYAEGLESVKRYLRARREAVILNEAKLIVIGEGEVGKSCLLAALREDPWEADRPTTHGIEIKPVKVTVPANNTEITLNGWDFGGQRVYRPTHQLFFTAPAVYLVVWKPREGPQQGFVKEWIKLVKHREPDAKILVVATHGGPKERQPDIDRQEIWDLFGRETVVDFFLVDSKPDEKTGERRGIAELRNAIADVASSLPEVGRRFPKHWHEARTTLRGLLATETILPLLKSLVKDEDVARTHLQRLGKDRLCLDRVLDELGDLVVDKEKTREALSTHLVAYLPLDRVLAICKEHHVETEDARLLLRICRRVGDLIHYEHDPALRDIVVLKPNWLATAISFVLDDEQTRKVGHGLVSFARLEQLWNDPAKPAENRYPPELHSVFLRLMERFDLCYRVAEGGETDAKGTSLIAQLVPDVRPNPVPCWSTSVVNGDEQQVQICRIVETAKNQSASAEGIFYQLIVRLHKYSLGHADYAASVHWQRGLVLRDNYGALAFLEHSGNDIRITVRSPYPERFLAALTYEVKWLVESFWSGLRCEVTVPCLVPQKSGEPCSGLFEVGKLIENKRRSRPEQPCPVCNEWQNIERLLHNSPTAQSNPLEEIVSDIGTMKSELMSVREILLAHHREQRLGFEGLDHNAQRILSKVDYAFSKLMQVLTDEAKEGPRLFSFQPVDPGFFDRPKWISEKFRLTLWCEHSHLPLPAISGKGRNAGVYEMSLPRDWFEKAAPFLKVLTGTLSLVLPVAASATKLMLDDAAYKAVEEELDLGQKSVDSVLKGGEKSQVWMGRGDALDLEHGEAVRAEGATLRQLHAWLQEKDPGFGGLMRVQNKRHEFLWVHPQFEKEY